MRLARIYGYFGIPEDKDVEKRGGKSEGPSATAGGDPTASARRKGNPTSPNNSRESIRFIAMFDTWGFGLTLRATSTDHVLNLRSLEISFLALGTVSIYAFTNPPFRVY